MNDGDSPATKNALAGDLRQFERAITARLQVLEDHLARAFRDFTPEMSSGFQGGGSSMDTLDLIREMGKLSALEARMTVVENRQREKEYQQLIARVERLERLQRSDTSEPSRSE
jgi:hypothetical protein